MLRKPTSIPDEAFKSTSTCNHNKHTDPDSIKARRTARMHPLADLRHITTSSLCRRAPNVQEVDRYRGRERASSYGVQYGPHQRSKEQKSDRAEIKRFQTCSICSKRSKEVLWIFWSFETLDPCDPLPDLARSSRAPFHQVSRDSSRWQFRELTRPVPDHERTHGYSCRLQADQAKVLEPVFSSSSAIPTSPSLLT